jgi:hypothetical protein
MHAYFDYYGISVVNDGHDIIHKWNYDQANQWGIPVNYHNKSYFSSSYNNPFVSYTRYGFKVINNLP